MDFEDGSFFLRRWPCPSLVKHYLDKGYQIVVKRSTAESAPRYWKISHKFITGLFRSEFWKETVEAEGEAALKMPKSAGCTHPMPCECNFCEFDQGFWWIWDWLVWSVSSWGVVLCCLIIIAVILVAHGWESLRDSIWPQKLATLIKSFLEGENLRLRNRI